MTIKKAAKTSASAVENPSPVTGGATIADRFKLDVPDQNAAKPSGKGGMITFIAALAALAVVGILTFVLYQHWEFLKDA